jgi:transmembrane sensor
MNPLLRLKQWVDPVGGIAPPKNDRILHEALEEEAGRLHSADPDTGRQWLSLNAVLEKQGAASRPRRLPARLRIAAVGFSFAVVSIVLIVSGVLVKRESPATYITGRGEQSTIMLADSSQVTLNHSTEFSVISSRDERRVLLKGEAFFRVRRTGNPFIVSTDAGTVQVLGTEFNVRIREDGLAVAVLSGAVRVSVRNNGKDSAVVLAPGQISVCSRGGFPGSPETLLFAEYPGWMHGKLLFQKTSLLSACEEIASEFDVEIGVESPRLRHETITGAVDARNAEAAVATIARLTGSKYRHEQKSYTLY